MLESFENLGYHHTVTSYETDGTSNAFETGNIFVPDGFNFWFRHGLPVEHDIHNEIGWSQPEGRFSEYFVNRVHSGNKSYMYFGFYRIMDAGLSKTITVKQGQKITTSVYAHAWSSVDDDPNTSEDALGPFSALETTYNLTDAQRNFTFWIGIDTTGNINPFAETVEWSVGKHIYNVFDKLELSTITKSETATIFIRAKSLWPFKHNDAYIDDLEITVEDVVQDCYGTPREQYGRTYYLLPQNSTAEQLKQIAEISHSTLSTIGFSADDAGIGDLENKKVVIVWFTEYSWGKGAIVDFFNTYYPGTQTEHLFLFDTPLTLTYPTTHLPAVITQHYSDSHRGLDLRSSYSVWSDELVSALDGVVTHVGYEETLPVYGYQVIIEGLHNNDTITLRYAHLVENGAYVQVGQTVKAGDKIGKPDNTGTSTGDHLHFGVKINGEYVDPEPLIDWPDDETPTEPPQNELASKNGVGLHILTNVDNSLLYNREAKPRVVKVFSGGDAKAYKEAFPECKVVFRKYIANDGWDFVNASDQHKAANEHLDAYAAEVEQYQNYIDYIESANETISHAYEQNLISVAYDVAFADELAKRNWNVAPALLNIAVGNPHETQFKDLIPAVEKIVEYNGICSYHSYWCANRDNNWLVENWPYYAGRFTAMDKVFNEHGLYPNYVFTEGGIVYSYTGLDMHSGLGWKACGSFENYLAQIDTYNQLLNDWNTEHGNRALGVTLFTVGGWGDWESFRIESGDLLLLRDWAKGL